MNEYVSLTDAIQYIENRTGKSFHPRTFARYVNYGEIEINEQLITLERRQIGKRWELSRLSLDTIVLALSTTAE